MYKTPIHTFYSVALSMIMLFGVLVPAHSGFMELCDMMQTEHHSMPMTDMEDCPMESGMMDHQSTDTGDCETVIGCDCDSDQIFSKAEATPVVQTQLPLADVSLLEEEHQLNFSDHLPPPILFSDSYSPPPLFLANASFLI